MTDKQEVLDVLIKMGKWFDDNLQENISDKLTNFAYSITKETIDEIKEVKIEYSQPEFVYKTIYYYLRKLTFLQVSNIDEIFEYVISQ